jgi:hypothetical protein
MPLNVSNKIVYFLCIIQHFVNCAFKNCNEFICSSWTKCKSFPVHAKKADGGGKIKFHAEYVLGQCESKLILPRNVSCNFPVSNGHTSKHHFFHNPINSMLLNSLVKFYMLYTVHYIIIIKNYRNAQIIKVSSPYFTTTQCTYYYTDIFTHPNKILTFLIPTVNIQHDGLDL